MKSKLLAVLVGSESGCCQLSKKFREKGVKTVVAPAVRDGFEVIRRHVPDFVVILLEEMVGKESVEVELIERTTEEGYTIYTVGSEHLSIPSAEVYAMGVRKCIPTTSSLEEIDIIVEEERRRGGRKPTEGSGKEVPSSILIGRSPEMQSIYDQIKKLAPTMAPVLITGESGTGKERAAEAIHRMSLRSEKPIVAANCGAIPAQLIQSELFGHVKGSFTGAVRDHEGYFEQAHGGTLFLDEITEMPIELQVNLLRVIETGSFRRVGGSQDRDADFRLVAATNRDPYEAVEDGHLREDLFYRIQVFQLRMPPLRGREEDIQLLAERMLDRHNEAGGTSKKLSKEALELFLNYHWPGNVRELKNVVYRSYILSEDVIRPCDLPKGFMREPGSAFYEEMCKPGTTIAEMEEKLIITTLNHCNGRKEEAARLLGISSKTLYNRLRDYRERRGIGIAAGNHI